MRSLRSAPTVRFACGRAHVGVDRLARTIQAPVGPGRRPSSRSIGWTPARRVIIYTILQSSASTVRDEPRVDDPRRRQRRVRARRPIVTHRGAMTLETRWTGRAWTCDDNVVVRAALTRTRRHARGGGVSGVGVVAARDETKSSRRWRRYIARVCEDTRRPSSIAGRIRRAMFSSPSTRRGRDARNRHAKRRGGG